jgi:hypothetical protein
VLRKRCRNAAEPPRNEAQTLCKHFVIAAQTLKERCANAVQARAAQTLQKRCRNAAETLQKRCRNAAETLQKRCRNAARTLHKRCTNTAETLRKRCANAAQSLSKLNASQLLRTTTLQGTLIPHLTSQGATRSSYKITMPLDYNTTTLQHYNTTTLQNYSTTTLQLYTLQRTLIPHLTTAGRHSSSSSKNTSTFRPRLIMSCKESLYRVTE